MNQKELVAWLQAQNPELYKDLEVVSTQEPEEPEFIPVPELGVQVCTDYSVPNVGVPGECVDEFLASVDNEKSTLYERYNGNRRKIANAIVREVYLPRLIAMNIYPADTVWHKDAELKRIAKSLRAFTSEAPVEYDEDSDSYTIERKKREAKQCIQNGCTLFVKDDGSPCASGHPQDELIDFITSAKVLVEEGELHPALKHVLSTLQDKDGIEIDIEFV